MSKTDDDRILQAIYGKAYGPADKSTIANREAAASAADPGRRVGSSDAIPLNYYDPRPTAAAPVFPPAQIDDPILVDDLPEDDGEPAMDRDLRAWLAENPDAVLTTQALLTNALHYVEEHISRADEMELAESMGRLGYEKSQRRFDGARAWVWVSQTPGAVVTNL